MLIRKLSAIAALSGFAMFSTPAIAEDADLKELLMKQQKQIEALQQKVEKQETVHNEALTHYIKNEIDRALEAKGSNLLTLGSHIENLEIKGDLRVRYEFRDDESGNDRDRFRQRFRLGFKWKTNEGWEIGAGLATGEANNADGASGATSTNDTFSANSPFETGGLFLDYAYAKHKWENGTSVTLGQHKNPFISSSLLWDSDVRFVGATANFTDKDSGFFATAGAYVVQSFTSDTGANDDANLLAAQVGIETGGLTAALAYYHFDTASSTDVLGVDKQNDVNLLSGYLGYAGKTDSFKYKVWGEYSVNLGADGNTSQATGNPDSEDIAWALGGEIGVDKWKFKYMYGYFESDSAFGPLTDADFATAVTGTRNSNNAEGHKLGLGYKVTKNFEVAATYINTERIEGGSGQGDGELFQLDFKYKF